MDINNKLVAFKGYIGRRDYILNLMYISMISAILSAPFSIWIATAVQNPFEAFNVGALVRTAPIFASFFWGVACIISAVLGFGLYSRRIADIRGEQGRLVYIWAAILALAPYLWVIKTNPITVLIFLICLVAGFIILVIPGKISGQIPHDELKRFNWGAFWGTWIWGLFNKAYITMWSIPLFFTPAFFSWAIVCGIKGNEWALKNQNADVEKFQTGQKHQAIFWNILAGFFIFILPILLVFLISAFAVTSAIKNPDGLQNFLEKTEDFVELVVDDTFESYELDVDENRFYMDPKNWVKLSYNDRYNALKGAAAVASLKKSRSGEEKYKGYKSSTSSEMAKTKIYSTYNGELLGEFKMDMDTENIKDFKALLKSAMKSLYFNTNPELPPDLPEVDN